MRESMLIAFILLCAACEGQHQPSTIRAAHFIYDNNLPPITADEFLYDNMKPDLHASQFLLNDK